MLVKPRAASVSTNCDKRAATETDDIDSNAEVPAKIFVNIARVAEADWGVFRAIVDTTRDVERGSFTSEGFDEMRFKNSSRSRVGPRR
jgi:hypothetical protein